MEQAPQQKFDIDKYVKILRRRKWWGIVIIFLGVVVAAPLVWFLYPKTYAAKCMLYIGATPAEEQIGYGWRITPERIANNKLEDIKQRMLTYASIRELIVGSDTSKPVRGLAEAEGIDVADEEEIEDLYNRIRYQVSINPNGSQYIEVAYKGKTQAIALNVVGELVDKFLDSWIREVKKEHEDNLERRREELEAIRRRLIAIDNTWRDFREQSAKDFSSREILIKSLAKINERLSEIDWELEAKEADLDYLKGRLLDTPPIRETLARYQKSIKARILDKAIADREIQKLLLADQYTADHPTIDKLDRNIEQLLAERERTEDEKVEHTEEPSPTYDKYRDLKNEAERDIIKLGSERVKRAQLQAKLRQDLVNLPQVEDVGVKYKRERIVLEKLLSEASKARADALRRFELAQFARINAFRKLGAPRSSPKHDIKAALGFTVMVLFVTIAASAAAMIGAEYLDQSFSAVDDARDFLRIPSLGVVPVIVTRGDIRRRRKKLLLAFAAVVMLIAVAVAAWLFIPGARDWLAGLCGPLLEWANIEQAP